MSNRLSGKVAIVTGAGTRGDEIGNGKACALMFAREGARVVAVDINLEAAEATIEQIRAEGGEGIAVKADVSRNEDCRAMVDACIERFDWSAHIEESQERGYTMLQFPEKSSDMRAYYKPNPDAVEAPGTRVPLPSYATEMDVECEMAAVIGVGGKDLSLEEARRSIVG